MRIVIIDGNLTDNHFHTYINPDNYPISAGAQGVHGISNEFLVGKPTFSEVVEPFTKFC